MSSKLVIVQPYVPEYRVSFFEGLQDRLSELGVECIVAAGNPRGNQAQRGDSARPDWLVPVKSRVLSIGNRSIDLGTGPAPWSHADAVILGLEGSSLSVYRALFAARYTGARVGLWGHIRPYVAEGHPIDLWLEKQQMSAADHIFAYTPGGRDYAVACGISSDKLTTVMNTVDTRALEAENCRLTPELMWEFSNFCNIDPARTLCFIGGLDESKRVEFLSQVLDELWQKDRSIRLLVGGEGPQKYLLNHAFDRGQALDMGYLDSHRKALVMSASKGVAMPGRIGLIAVDALVMRRPIITTNWPYHAPESEYISEGISRITTGDSPVEYADSVIHTLAAYQNAPNTSEDWRYPTLDQMVHNFSKGVMQMLSCERT